MLKFVFYLVLMMAGVIGTFVNPVWGVIASIGAYLLNPATIQMAGADTRFQFYTSTAFLLSCLILRPQPLPKAGREGALLVCMWTFVAIGYLSSLWAVVSTQQALDEMYEILKTVIAVTFFIRAIRTEKHLSLVIMACVLGVFHASWMHTFGVRMGYVNQSLGREYGVLPEGQTSVLVLFIPLIVLLIIRGQKWERFIALATLPFALNSIISTYQRVGLMVLIMEMVFLLFFLPKRITFKLLPVAAAVALLFVYRLAPENYWVWMSTMQTPTEEGSAASRFVINDCSRRMLADYPFGVGYRNYLDVSPRYLDASYLDRGRRSAHNSFYSIACEFGIPGFIAFMATFGGLALLLRRIRKRADPRNTRPHEVYAMGLEIGVYGWFVNGLTHDVSNVDPIFWFIAFAIVIARLAALQPETDEESEELPDEAPVPA